MSDASNGPSLGGPDDLSERERAAGGRQSPVT